MSDQRIPVLERWLDPQPNGRGGAPALPGKHRPAGLTAVTRAGGATPGAVHTATPAGSLDASAAEEGASVSLTPTGASTEDLSASDTSSWIDALNSSASKSHSILLSPAIEARVPGSTGALLQAGNILTTSLHEKVADAELDKLLFHINHIGPLEKAIEKGRKALAAHQGGGGSTPPPFTKKQLDSQQALIDKLKMELAGLDKRLLDGLAGGSEYESTLPVSATGIDELLLELAGLLKKGRYLLNDILWALYEMGLMDLPDEPPMTREDVLEDAAGAFIAGKEYNYFKAGCAGIASLREQLIVIGKLKDKTLDGDEIDFLWILLAVMEEEKKKLIEKTQDILIRRSLEHPDRMRTFKEYKNYIADEVFMDLGLKDKIRENAKLIKAIRDKRGI